MKIYEDHIEKMIVAWKKNTLKLLHLNLSFWDLLEIQHQTYLTTTSIIHKTICMKH